MPLSLPKRSFSWSQVTPFFTGLILRTDKDSTYSYHVYLQDIKNKRVFQYFIEKNLTYINDMK